MPSTNATSSHEAPRQVPAAADSSKIAVVLRRTLSHTAVGRVWKDCGAEKAALLPLAAELMPDLAGAMQERLASLDHAAELARTPVIGVCGTMNSGKSTLVASFLSEQNRRRVLVGDYENEATQRFVFWLPESLRQDRAAVRCFDEMFASQFGSPAENLDEDPGAAARQYSARDAKGAKLGIPLVAHDAALDANRLSFLDCPDIQRPVNTESPDATSHLRLDALVKAARLCSAFILVCSQEQFSSMTPLKILSELGKHAPGLPVFLVLNKASADAARDIANAEAVLADWNVRGMVRALYHAPYQQEVHERSQWPAFASLSGDNISCLPGSLEVSELGRAYLRSGITELQGTLHQTIESIVHRETEITGEVRQVHKHVRKFLAEHFLDDAGNVRTLLSEGISKAILESMERTAPWEIGLALWANKPIAALLESIQEGAGAVATWVRDYNPFAGSEPESPWKNPESVHTVTPESFAEHLKPLRCIRTDVEEGDLAKVWTSALRALKDLDMSEQACDADELDKIMTKLWDDVPWYKRAIATFVLPASLIATVTAVLFIPVDWGTSVIKLASVKELLTALGISALFHKAAVSDLTGHLETRAGLQQVANVHAAILDGLRLPREEDAELRHRKSGRRLSLPSPTVTPQPFITSVLEHPVIELDHAALQAIRDTLDQIKP